MIEGNKYGLYIKHVKHGAYHVYKPKFSRHGKDRHYQQYVSELLCVGQYTNKLEVRKNLPWVAIQCYPYGIKRG